MISASSEEHSSGKEDVSANEGNVKEKENEVTNDFAPSKDYDVEAYIQRLRKEDGNDTQQDAAVTCVNPISASPLNAKHPNGVALTDAQQRFKEVNRQIAMHRRSIRGVTGLTMGQALLIEANRVAAIERSRKRKEQMQRDESEGAAQDTTVSFHTPDSGGAASSSDPGISTARVEAFDFDDDFEIASEPEWVEAHSPQQMTYDDLDHERLDSLAADGSVQNEAKKRRLRSKTNPTQVPAFPQRPLIRATELKIKRHQLKQAQLQQNQALRTIKLKAISLLASHTFRVGCIDANNDLASLPLQTPHDSHYILALPTNETVIWCKACGYWSQSEKLRGLGKPCEGLKAGNSSNLRLLKCGIKPGPNARLPPYEVKRRQRKSRW